MLAAFVACATTLSACGGTDGTGPVGDQSVAGAGTASTNSTATTGGGGAGPSGDQPIAGVGSASTNSTAATTGGAPSAAAGTATTDGAPSATAGNATTDGAPSATAATATSWVKCAGEDETCSFSGTREVRYGTESQSVSKVVTGNVACDNTTFGDPAVGAYKDCWYAATPAEAGPAVAAIPPPAPSAATATATATTTATTPGAFSGSVVASALVQAPRSWPAMD